MSQPQPAILRPLPERATFVSFSLGAGAEPRAALARLAAAEHDPRAVIGIGAPLARLAARAPAGLRGFPTDLGLHPSTQGALWAWLTHEQRGEAFDAGRLLARLLGSDFVVSDETEAFVYRGGRDLSGFEDGTENPKGDAAARAAIVQGRGEGLDGGSFVAVQRWVHDLQAFESLDAEARQAVIGRHVVTNEELPDAPPSAHVKRTAQESFEPPAFILRRSMPWGGPGQHGLYFVAFGESLDRYERILRRMAGREDGIVDGLMVFTRPVTGEYYFCPPLRDGKLDLRALGA
jgi:putative iron-dependent peroxidase